MAFTNVVPPHPPLLSLIETLRTALDASRRARNDRSTATAPNLSAVDSRRSRTPYLQPCSLLLLHGLNVLNNLLRVALSAVWLLRVPAALKFAPHIGISLGPCALTVSRPGATPPNRCSVRRCERDIFRMLSCEVAPLGLGDSCWCRFDYLGPVRIHNADACAPI